MSLKPTDPKSIFLAAIEKYQPTEWAAYLDGACGTDADLRHRVEELLRAHHELGSFHESPALPVISGPLPRAEQAGSIIGPYKLLQQIGEGGMGAVYMAEQTRPFRRKVALKLIKTGFDNRQVIARFEAERQALALMDHPNIAKVLDAGTTDSGRPYFVMELVKGVPIIDYCDQQQLSIRERLELVIAVCHAVQHAHHKGIIHRDLKPSNVLVAEYDGQPVAKIIDFGVAKAIGQRLTEQTMFTNFGQIVGTFEYMSPEQARLNQLDIDTRSDVYSLGVMLYELLTGTTPFEKGRCEQAAFDEILRIIREEEPPRPSTRLSASGSLPAIAARRCTEPARLTGLVRGEMDWIAMKALDKDRGRRYQTAGALAADLQRYLHDEPVEACPPSAAYRLVKFARRNRGLLMTMGLVATAIIVGLAASISQALRATKAEQLAEARLKTESKARADANTARANAEANAHKARAAVNDMYTQVAEKWLAHQPQMEPIQREFLEKARQYYEEFVQESATDSTVRLETARACRRVAEIRHRLGQTAQAEEAFRNALDRLQALVDEFPATPDFRAEMAATLHKLGVLLGDTGRYLDEEKLHRRALALNQQLAAEVPTNSSYRCDLGRAHWHVAQVLISLHRRSEAEPAYRGALAIQNALVSEFPLNADYREQLADSQLGLGQTLRLVGQSTESRQALGAAVNILEQLAAEFPNRPGYRNQLANAYYWRMRGPVRSLPTTNLAEAERDLRKAVALQHKLVESFPAVPDYRFDLCRSLKTLGWLLSGTGRPEEAESSFRESVAIAEKLAGEYSSVHYYRGMLAEGCQTLGKFLANSGQLAAAEDAFRRSVSHLERLIAESPDVPAHRNLLRETYFQLASLLKTAGRTDDEADVYCKALQVRGDDPAELCSLSWQLLRFPDARIRDPTRAVGLAQKAVELAPDDAKTWRVLGVAHYYTDHWEEAVRAFVKAHALQRDGFDFFVAAMAHWRLGYKEEARQRFANDARWMDKNNPSRDDLVRFRAEAAELLAITEPESSADPAPVEHEPPFSDNAIPASSPTTDH